MNTYFLGLDIGGTKCAVVVGNDELKVLERQEIPTDHSLSPNMIIEQMITISKNFIEKYKESGIFRSVGISCGGPLDENRGIILSPPNLPGWDNVFITSMVSEKLYMPTFLRNDANACAIAEWKMGAGVGCKNMIFLTFGTGLGAGLILNGKLYSGTNGMAGEVGHIRLSSTGPIGYGKKGSFEGYCSGGGIKRLCSIMGKEAKFDRETVTFLGKEYEFQDVNAKLIFQKAKEGDKFALEIVDVCAKYLGKGLAILVDILNPQKIVLGSIFVRGESLLRKQMEQQLLKEALYESNRVCEVVPAMLGESIGDIAALSVAKYSEEING